MKRNRGFTLVELMITVAIIGIIASVAYPAYTNYIQKARRTEAHTALLKLVDLQERWYMEQSAYVTDNAGITASLNYTTTTANGYYTLSVSATSGYTFTATAAGAQAGDSDCATLTLNADGAKGSSPGSDCW